MKTQSNIQPQAVVITNSENTANIRLVKNIEEIQNEEHATYQYDEITFSLPYRGGLQEAIEGNFDVYWTHGLKQKEEKEGKEVKIQEVARLVSNAELPTELQVLMLAIAEAYEQLQQENLELSLALAEVYEQSIGGVE